MCKHKQRERNESETQKDNTVPQGTTWWNKHWFHAVFLSSSQSAHFFFCFFNALGKKAQRLPVNVMIKGFKGTLWTDPGSLKKSCGTVCSEHNQSTSTALERAVISLLSGGCFACQRAWCDKPWRVWTYSQNRKRPAVRTQPSPVLSSH